jgi:hypothetical protein
LATGNTETHEYGLWTYKELKCINCGQTMWEQY